VSGCCKLICRGFREFVVLESGGLLGAHLEDFNVVNAVHDEGRGAARFLDFVVFVDQDADALEALVAAVLD